MANATFGTYDPTDPRYGTTPQTPNLPPGQFLEDPTADPTAGTGVVDPNARSKFQAAWQAAPTHDEASLQALIASDPAYKGISAQKDLLSLPGYTEAGTGIYRGPEQIDAIRDVGGANGWAWSGTGGPNGDGTTGAGAGSGAAPGAAGSSATGAPIAADPYSQEVSDQISKLLTEGNTPVTADSMRDQFAPVDAQFQRGAKRAREQAAERFAQNGQNAGGSGGALDTTVNGINENLAGSEGSLMASLMGNELQARRQKVTDALGFAQGEQKNQLEMQLAQIDAQLKQQSLGLQSQQIGNQNSQFYDSLSARLGEDANNSNSILSSLLGL